MRAVKISLATPYPLLYVSYLLHYFTFKGSLVDPRVRASNEINAPSKLARFLSKGGD